MKKKILAIALVIAMLAVAIVSASLAYFTDEDYATNTFTVGEVDIDLREDFGNTPEEDDGIDDTDNTEEHFYPGVAVNKDVWVANTSTTENSAYVRVHVAFPVELAPRSLEGNTYKYDIAGDDGLAVVTLYDGATTQGAYEAAWVWDEDPYFAKIGQDAANQIDCVVFVATYQKVLEAGKETDVDAISAVTLNPKVDSDMTTTGTGDAAKDELVLFLDINTKNGKFDGADNELWVKAQGDKTPNFTIDIEVAAEAVQIEGFAPDTPDNALDTAFGVPGTYDLSDATDESSILWTGCIEADHADFPNANP